MRRMRRRSGRGREGLRGCGEDGLSDGDDAAARSCTCHEPSECTMLREDHLGSRGSSPFFFLFFLVSVHACTLHDRSTRSRLHA
jgi:hypothetical protein